MMTTMVHSLRLMLLAFVILVGLTRVSAGAADKPDIVFIYIDDLGYGDIGPYGSKLNRTPNLDKMAAEGMKLTSFYCAPVCSVSRSQVMTGCYGQRVSIPGVFGPASGRGINSTEHTVAELLKQQGYATQIVGKWHLGDQPQFLPTHHGFDHYLGIPYSNDMIKAARDGSMVVPLVRDDKVQELLTEKDQDQIVRRYTEEAVKFLREHKDGPFFLYLPHTAVHNPLHPGDNFRGKSGNGTYGDWVEEVDWSVGQIMQTLHDLHLDENTLVMFSSDNGPWMHLAGNHGNAGPLRGAKRSTFEGGMREPTLARWTGKIAAGSTCDAITGNIDLLPTFVKLAGGTVPTDHVIDGKDISPLLLGQTKQSPRGVQYYYNSYKLQAVRQGPWKLALGPQEEFVHGRENMKDILAPGVRLYNLDTDIGEKQNVADAHPDVVKELKTLALAMAAQLGDGKPGPDVRPAGVAENPTLLYPGANGGKKKDGKPAAPASKPMPIPLDTLKPGDILSADAAPQIGRVPFVIACEVETDAATGVIVAQGGIGVGYSLHLKDRHVLFSIRNSRTQLTSIAADKPLAGKTSIEARLGKDGSMALLLNGQPAAQGKCSGLIATQPKEDFCIGNDNAQPVAEYAEPLKFTGTIRNLRVTASE